MRAVLLATTGLAALATLSGCDLPNLGGQRTAQEATPPCHCTSAAAPEEHLARLEAPAIHRHHRYRHSSHSYSQDWAGEYEQQSSSSYESQSRDYEDSDQDSDESEEVSGERAEIWVDGYGRKHLSGGAVTRVAADDRERLDPWHAYKSKCADRDK